MRKTISIFIAIFAFTLQTSYSQKFGYIDSDFIIKKLPDYAKAEKELSTFSEKWQKDIEAMKAEIDKLQQNFKAEEVLFTEEMRKERLDTISLKEKKYKEQQKKIFGFEGMLFLKRQELMKPVQDKIFEAVEKVAKAKQLQIIFDKSGDLVMLYTNPIHDYTDYVLEALGLGDPKDTVDNKKE